MAIVTSGAMVRVVCLRYVTCDSKNTTHCTNWELTKLIDINDQNMLIIEIKFLAANVFI